MGKQKGADSSIQLMSSNRVKRSIKRMAYQIAEDNGDACNILVIGLKERGYVVAKELTKQLQFLSKKNVSLIRLPEEQDEDLAFDLTKLNDFQNKVGYLLVIDDVIFTGQTMLTAIQEVNKYITDQTLRTVALVDRGHRKVPVEATFTGLNSPTKLDEHVQVRVNETGLKEVILTKPVN